VTGLVTAFGSGAMTNSISDLQQAQAFLIIGSNTTEQHPIIGLEVRRAVRNGAKLILADPRRIDLARIATVHLRHRSGTDVALLNGLAHIILQEGLHHEAFIAARTEGFEEWRAVVETYTPERVSAITGVPEQDLREAARLYATAKPAAILYAMGITQHVSGHNNVLAVANLALLTGNLGIPGGGVNPLRGQNNVQGACDMGALPNFLPGYQRVTDDEVRAKFEAAWGVTLPAEPGLTVVEMFHAAERGDLKALYIMGENPMMTDPDTHHVQAALENLDFLVVQDIFLTETAQLADVVLPTASFAEKEGTFTNTERRVQRLRQALDPPGEARADGEILQELAGRMGYRLLGDGEEREERGDHGSRITDHASRIMDEIASLTPSYGGIHYDRLENGGLQWPCPTADHPGTPILHVERFPRGRGRFSPVEYTPPPEEPDAEYPLLLTTGRRLEHYHSGSMTRRVEGLNALVPEERIEINAADAASLGLNDGDWVQVTSRRGQVRVRASVGKRCPPGTVFMTFHFAEALGNRLTNPALDPVSKIPTFKVCAVRVEKVEG
jgi:formate dehydrogenase major subunit